jgi:ParB family chromosome partitioning protein
MKQEIREIELRRITPNLRIVCTSESIEEIARGIRSRGQQEPIHVWFVHDSFRILDGEKRWRALKILGIKTIRAVIEDR